MDLFHESGTQFRVALEHGFDAAVRYPEGIDELDASAAASYATSLIPASILP